MITGKINGEDFSIIDGEVSCKDKSFRKYIKAVCDIVFTGFQPQDGDPELYILKELKKSGAKDLKHTPDNQEGVIY